MYTDTELLDILLEDVWQALPPIKQEATIASIGLGDLGAVHGTWDPETCQLKINPVLFKRSPLSVLPLIDANGDSPAHIEPWVSRAYHTLAHEIFHAIGSATGLDICDEFLVLSGWVKAEDDPPGTSRYFERRPGWEQGPSAWRYVVGVNHASQHIDTLPHGIKVHPSLRVGPNWFVREYSTKSPYEDFADSCTHLMLGWDNFFDVPNGQAEAAWLRRNVFGETGRRGLQARVQRWGARYHACWSSSLTATRQKKRAVPWDERVRRVLAATVGAVVTQWARGWHQAVAVGQPFPTAASMATDLTTALTGAMASMGVSADELSTLDRAVQAFTATTTQRLAADVVPLLGRPQAVVGQAVARIVENTQQVRTPLFARTESARLSQQRIRARALDRGMRTATWHTTSAEPCEFCTSLDGVTFPVDTPLYRVGETLTSARGRTMAVSYADVWHPPIHPQCQCKVEYH